MSFTVAKYLPTHHFCLHVHVMKIWCDQSTLFQKLNSLDLQNHITQCKQIREHFIFGSTTRPWSPLGYSIYCELKV